MRPGSQAARPGSGVRMTSYGGPAGAVAGVGKSLESNVEVTARPALQGGMRAAGPSRSGLTTSSGYGPGRQVADRSYHMGLLRQKTAELTAEIERLKQQEELINRNSTTVVQLQNKGRQLADEITQLKAAMGDVNFAVERANTHDAESVSTQAQQLRQANAEQRRAVDKLLLESKQADRQSRENAAALEQELRALEQRLASENQDVGLYRATRDEAYAAADSVLLQLHEVRTLAAKQELLLQQLSLDADKKRAAAFLLDILKKRQQRDDMAKECSLSVDEEKQLLIKQAKATRDDIEVLERQVAEMKEAVADAKSRAASAADDLKEYTTGENARAYQELQDKDREMQEFLDAFPANERDEHAKIKQLEAAIVELLERMARAQTLKAQMPTDSTPKMLEALSAELGEKEAQLANAKVTHQRLEKELAERRDELAKVTDLDEKIAAEMQGHQQRMAEQRQDIARFSDIDALRREVDARRRDLTARKGFLLRQRDGSKHLVHTLTASFEAKKQKLNENDVHVALAAQEQKLRLIWQSVFGVEEFVRHKEKETQYTNVKADCMRITDECNALLKDPKRFDSSAAAAAGGVGVGPTFVK